MKRLHARPARPDPVGPTTANPPGDSSPLLATLGLLALLILVACGKNPPTSSSDEEIPTPTTPRKVSAMQRAELKYDMDEDGELSSDEKARMNTDFTARFDQNRDGKLDQAEMATARKGASIVQNSSSTIPTTLDETEQFLKRMDTNLDGLVSAEEAGESRWKAMTRADKNADGSISAQEWLDWKTTGQRN